MPKAGILDFQDGRHVKSKCAKISAGKPHRRSMLVSKLPWAGSHFIRNAEGGHFGFLRWPSFEI